MIIPFFVSMKNIIKIIFLFFCLKIESIGVRDLATLRIAKKDIEKFIKTYKQSNDQEWYDTFEKKLATIEKFDTTIAATYRKQIPKPHLSLQGNQNKTDSEKKQEKTNAPENILAQQKPFKPVTIVDQEPLKKEYVQEFLNDTPSQITQTTNLKDETINFPQESTIQTTTKKIIHPTPITISNKPTDDAKKQELIIALNPLEDAFAQTTRNISVIDQESIEPKIIIKGYENIAELEEKIEPLKKIATEEYLKKEEEIKEAKGKLNSITILQITKTCTNITNLLTPLKNRFTDMQKLITKKGFFRGQDTSQFDEQAYIFFWGRLNNSQWKRTNSRKRLEWFAFKLGQIKRLFNNNLYPHFLTIVNHFEEFSENDITTINTMLENLSKLTAEYARSLGLVYQGMKRIQTTLSEKDQEEQNKIISDDYLEHLKIVSDAKKRINEYFIKPVQLKMYEQSKLGINDFL